ncbi:MAG: class I SAM-dependent methyltransferase [Nannocystaceae bacterium]|nr:methyltransferase domain-containing protein [bacterium]
MSEDSTDPWGQHASTYDRVFAPLTGYIARSMLAMTDARLPEGARVLDIACGSGALLIPAIERAQRHRARGGTDFVVGCDFSEGMVNIARDKARARFEPDAFSCTVQDGQALSEADASFDAAFSCFGIFLFPDRAAGWREAARVLRPGGVFAATSWVAPEHNEMFRAQFGPMMEALPERITDGMSPPDWLVVADPEAFAAEVTEAGFRDVQTRQFRTEFVLPSAEVAWSTMLDNPIAGAIVRECTEAERAAVRSAFDASMHARSGGPGRPIVLEAVCNVLTATRA